MIGNNNVGSYTLDSIDLVKLRRKGDNILSEDSLMSNKMYSDILYAKSDVVNVQFASNGLPIPFTKTANDQQLEDIEDPTYKEDLKKAVDTSFGPIPHEETLNKDVGGNRKKRKTRRKIYKSTKRKVYKRKNKKTRKARHY